jgi:enoyl-CoA hydratase/carnithine racemase
MPPVTYSIDGHIATITLNRPEKLNAINAETSRLLYEIFLDVRDNDDVRLAILTGNGRAFSAGRDLVERQEKGDLPGKGNADIYELQQAIFKPTIVAINGLCLAAASGFAMSMDIRIMARSAYMGWPHAKRGISSVSGPVMLTRLIPTNIALHYLFTGEPMQSSEALRWGLVNEVVEDGEALPRALEIARQIMANSPVSIRNMKEASRRVQQLRLEDGFMVGEKFVKRVDDSEDQKEGLLAFKEKRDPVWPGR